MIVKIEKKSDTEYAKYSDCPDASVIPKGVA